MKKCMSFRRQSSSFTKRSAQNITACLLLVSMLLAFTACNAGQSNTQEAATPKESDGPTVPAPETASKSSGSIVEKGSLDMTKPYIVIYNVYGTEEKYIQLDVEAANTLTKELNSISEISITDKIGTDAEFFCENIYLFVGDKLKGTQSNYGGGYSVLMNGDGKMCLRDVDAGIDYSAYSVCERIISIANDLGVYFHVTKDDIKSIVKAELTSKESKSSEITDEKTLSKIEQLFVNAERTVNPGTYNLGQVLTLTNADGKTIEIELDDDHDICVIGHTYWYDYGPGVDGDNARNARPELFALMG